MLSRSRLKLKVIDIQTQNGEMDHLPYKTNLVYLGFATFPKPRINCFQYLVKVMVKVKGQGHPNVNPQMQNETT